MWQYNPFTGKFEKVGLINVAPYCTIEATGWTGSQSGEVLATGDGTTVDFSGKVDLPPVNPLNSFTLHYTIGGTAYSVQADANGNFSDANVTGSVAQDGTWNATFNTAPDDATDITADYSYGIPPANLENALDPSNPNPSDWGWKTTTGASILGDITITPPVYGFYFFGIRTGSYSNNGAILQFRLQTVDNTGASVFTAYLHDNNSFIVERKRNSYGIFLKLDSITPKIQIRLYANAADTYYVRFYDIVLYRLG